MFLHLTITTFNVIDSRLCVWWVGDTVLTFLLSFRHTQNCLAWSLIMDHEAGLRGHTHRTQVIRIFLLHMFYILRPLTLLLMLRRQDDGTLISFYDTRHVTGACNWNLGFYVWLFWKICLVLWGACVVLETRCL